MDSLWGMTVEIDAWLTYLVVPIWESGFLVEENLCFLKITSSTIIGSSCFLLRLVGMTLAMELVKLTMVMRMIVVKPVLEETVVMVDLVPSVLYYFDNMGSCWKNCFKS